MAGNVSEVAGAIARIAKSAAPAHNKSHAQATALGEVAVGGNLRPLPGTVMPADKLEKEIIETIAKDIGAAVEQINRLAEQNERNLHFRVDRASGRTIITVFNPSTGEIVRQIPPQELLLVAKSLGINRQA